METGNEIGFCREETGNETKEEAGNEIGFSRVETGNETGSRAVSVPN